MQTTHQKLTQFAHDFAVYRISHDSPSSLGIPLNIPVYERKR
jgi:hypothetical protein